MRFNPTLTLCAALFVLVLTNNSEAQTDSSRRTSSNAKLQGNFFSRVQSATTTMRQPAQIDMRTPSQPISAEDSSSTPRKLAPAIHNANFVVRGDFEPTNPTANEQVSSNSVPPPIAFSEISLDQPHVASRVFIDSSNVFVTTMTAPSHPAQFAQNVFAQPMPRRSFFGIDEDQCCDEWEGFSGCGGLKADPGHYGVKWLRGKDACERDKACRSQSHRDKKDCKKNCRQTKCPCCD